jgi:cell division septal protein FtsQ
MIAWLHRIVFNKASAIILGLTLAIGVTYLLGWSNVFTVKEVVVFGAPTVGDKHLIEREVAIGEKIARLNTRSISKDLTKLTWLDDSSLRTDWFKGVVTIRVSTRKPLAIVYGKLIDSKGMIFQLPNVDMSRFPTIIANSNETRLIGVSLISQIPDSMLKKLVVISIPGKHSVTLDLRAIGKLQHPLSIFWGDLTSTPLKVRVYQSLLALPENAKISMMDLSAPHAPIVR